MLSRSTDTTIAAIATPPGLGGIAVLRMSGPSARSVLHRLFVPASSRLKRTEIGARTKVVGYTGRAGDPTAGRSFAFRPRYMHYGYALDAAGQVLDEVLAVFMPGPHSATGEDVGEIHCHGGMGITSALLEACLAAGARLAGPGEFTRRAFLNGRIDLTQAEAVAEMISAPTHQGIRLARAKLEGVLARKIDSLRESLDALRVQVTLAVDFPDEDAELLPRPAFTAGIGQARREVRALLDGFVRARLWREGATAVLVGRVNAGKSSLLNALLGRRRAIVSDQPGTTRDYIEEYISLQGMPLRLIDTAGLRRGGDVVEEEGIRRSRDLAAESDVLLLVLDARLGMGAEEWEFLGLHEALVGQGRVLVVLNKVDEPAPTDCRPEGAPGPSPEREALLHRCPAFAVSAKEGYGLEELAAGVHRAVAGVGGAPSSEQGMQGDLAPNLRQAHLLEQALGELDSLEEALVADLPPDILGVHLDTAVLLLDEVTGSTSNEELLDRIFSSFCIGK